MAYMGIVSFYRSGKRIYLTPPKHWTGYDPTWSWYYRQLKSRHYFPDCSASKSSLVFAGFCLQTLGQSVGFVILFRVWSSVILRRCSFLRRNRIKVIPFFLLFLLFWLFLFLLWFQVSGWFCEFTCSNSTSCIFLTSQYYQQCCKEISGSYKMSQRKLA